MATTVTTLVPSKFAENSQTTQYTAAAGTKVVIDKFTVTNNGAASATLSVNLVPSGDTAGDENRIINAKAVTPGECYTCPEVVGHDLVPGEFISTLASAASTLTIRVSGRVAT